jgi:hypothetical protein
MIEPVYVPYEQYRAAKTRCGLDSRSRAGVWPNDRAGVRAVRTIQGSKNEVQIRFENIRYMQQEISH